MGPGGGWRGETPSPADIACPYLLRLGIPLTKGQVLNSTIRDSQNTGLTFSQRAQGLILVCAVFQRPGWATLGSRHLCPSPSGLKSGWLLPSKQCPRSHTRGPARGYKPSSAARPSSQGRAAHTHRGAYLDTPSAAIYEGASWDPASKHHVPNVQAAAPRGTLPAMYQSTARASIQKQRHQQACRANTAAEDSDCMYHAACRWGVSYRCYL